MKMTIKALRQKHRERREAGRIYRATKHLAPHTLNDIGVLHMGRKAYHG